MTITVSPTVTTPTHHIKLSDGVNSVGLILRSGNRIDPRAITRRPRQNGQYSPFTQSDWGGGRGIKDASSDRSRFGDSKRAITRHVGTVMNGGLETYTTGYRNAEQFMPGNVTWQSLLTTERYIAYKFTASATGNRSAIYLWIRRRGTPTSTLTVELCSDNAGNPDTVLKTVTKTTTDITDTVSQLVEFAFSSVQAVTATTAYWVKVYTSSADSSTNYWQVGTDAERSNALTKCSSDNGSTDAWAAATYDLYFRIVDDTDLLGGLFFTYKGALYFVTRPSGASAPKLYINGYRGIATGAGQTTTVLQDSTQTFTVDALIGSVLYIQNGTNSEWQTPYRTITDNDADEITTAAFPKAHVAASTEYVILGSNVWTEITGHGLTVLPTSVISDGEICYFAQGDSVKMRKMIERNVAGVWTRTFAQEDNYAQFLGIYKHQTKGTVIFKTNQDGGSGVPTFSQSSPVPWGTAWRLAFPFLLDDGQATTGWTFGTNVTGSSDTSVFQTKTASIKMIKAAGSATTSPFAYKTFSPVINAFKGGQIRFWVYSDTAIASGGLSVRLSAAADCSTSLIGVATNQDIPAFDWVEMKIPYADTTSGLWAIASVGFITSSNATIWVDGLDLCPNGSEVVLGNKSEKITGVTSYGDPEVPWVFRTQSAGSIENGVFNPIPLKELSTAENIHNGMGHTVHNVYLYFSFLHGLERFYRNNLDDVGPNRDEGLPDGRRGHITDMKGYIGRFFYNYDVPDGYSCIMESTSGTDHHEAFRSDTAGKRIRNLFVQVIPGDTADRLWFTEGEDIVWLPLPGNTLKEDTDDTFYHTHESVLETGWLTGSDVDAVKLYSSVRLTTENLTSNRKIEVDYKTDESTTWTPVSTAVTTSPVQEVSLNISCKRMKLRFRMQTNDKTETPTIRGMFVSGTTRPETRWTYSMNTYSSDAAIDIQGNEDYNTSAEDVVTQLDAWMEANTTLTMSSVFTSFHNRQVILEPVIVQPLTFIADESKETFTLTINLIEP